MSSETGGWAWWWSHDGDAEDCHGPCASREEAIAEGSADDPDREFVTVLEARKGTLANRLPQAATIIEDMLERAHDEGDFGEDPSDRALDMKGCTKAAEAELDGFLRDWFTRHAALFPEPWVFAQTRNQETVPVVKEEE